MNNPCFAPWLLIAVFAAGFATLAARLKTEQIDRSDEHRAAMASQSYRYAATAGERGRILARGGYPLAANRKTFDLVADPAAFASRGDWSATAESLLAAIERLAGGIGRKPDIDEETIARHLKAAAARPLAVWRGLSIGELAKFEENASDFPGFFSVERSERTYPLGAAAVHVTGRTGRDSAPPPPGGAKYDYTEMEPRGRDGLELQYDEYLRGAAGETRIAIDARGFARHRENIVPPQKGPDLSTGIDVVLQRAVHSQLEGVVGAMVVLDPRDGAVRAMASSPSFDPGDCVPVFPKELYDKYVSDPAKPLFNRAAGGVYAPGSTFKPITALAALGAGIPADTVCECTGAFATGGEKIRCARTWGHGSLDLRHAMCESCNPYFCEIGVRAGIDAIAAEAELFGFGAKTQVDLPSEAAGLVPGPAWKARRRNGAAWRDGDTAQTSIGQGALLASPLQMARAAAALGTGWLCRPRLNTALPVVRARLAVPEEDFAAVRDGMRLVVERGSGRPAAENVAAMVIGKTGTAQTGSGETRRKNTWFIAYVEPTDSSLRDEPLALAVVVEDGESGGETAAPRVGAVLRAFYGAAAHLPVKGGGA